MTDLRTTSQEQLAYEIAQRASEAGACPIWAHVQHTTDGPDRDPMLWPRNRGPIHGMGYRASAYIAHKGLLMVTLTAHDELDHIGVPVATQLAALGAQYAATATDLTPRQVDHVIQCGLFGEVLYP